MLKQWNIPTLFKNTKILLRVFVIALGIALLSACDNPLDKATDLGEPNLGAVKAEVQKCWSCPVFTIAFNSVKSTYEAAQARAAGPAVTLMGVAFGLWLAIRVMKLVASLKEPDTGSFWTDLGVRTFWLIMGVAMLRNISQVMDMIVFPTFSGFIDFGLLVVGRLPSDVGGIACPTGSPQEGMVCLVKAIHERLAVGQELGFAVMLAAPVFQKVFGVIIYAVSVFMGMVFPVFLLDGVLRFGIIMALLPMWIVAFCYPITRDLAKKAWNALMGVCIQTAGMSVFAALCVLVLRVFLLNKFPLIFSAEAVAREEKEVDAIANGSPGIIGFMFICFFLVLFGNVILDLVNQNFVSGAGGGGGTFAKAGMAAVNMAKVPAQAASKKMGKMRDKKAAKTLETARRKERAGEKLSTKERIKAARAESRMRNRGHIDTVTGKDNDSFGKLLGNSVMDDLRGKKDFAQDYDRDIV